MLGGGGGGGWLCNNIFLHLKKCRGVIPKYFMDVKKCWGGEGVGPIYFREPRYLMQVPDKMWGGGGYA